MLTFSELRTAHQVATEALDQAVHDVPQSRFPDATPCAEWTIADLLAHQQGQNHGFALAIADGDAPAEAFAPQPWDAQLWRAESAAVLAAFKTVDQEAAIVLQEFGPAQGIPIQIVLSMHLADTVIHHWDLAAALGQPFTPAPAAVEATWDILSQVPDGGPRGEPGATFALRVESTDDDRWHQALALSGRDPHRTPARLSTDQA